ncbi:hypothetical protein LPY66_06160 [Dehalobacter sp. DCM]|uniref:hypothetical protein n=1 Tax=Dehalobacter sp. DCM TaxID=2907827 RepID=UPI0030817D30|nr:hypothetical protein LPY66_06160 [Dehalobacter sp. DCM]
MTRNYVNANYVPTRNVSTELLSMGKKQANILLIDTTGKQIYFYGRLFMIFVAIIGDKLTV